MSSDPHPLSPCGIDNNTRARPSVGLTERHLLVPPLRHAERGPGGEDHRRGAGFGFGMRGSLTITSPRAVTPKSSWLPDASFATRSGPTIGSRTGIEPITL